MDLIVGIGQFEITNNENAFLKTYSLSSCVAVTVYSPLRKVAGMIHVVLPAPFNDQDGVTRPGYYAKTGIPLLINTMCRKYGCRKEELQVQMYGGARSRQSFDIYDIGRKNVDAVKKILSELGLSVQKTDLLGTESRSITMEAKTGLVTVYRQPLCFA